MEKQAKKRRVLVIDPHAKTITESFVASLEDCQAIVGGRIEQAASGGPNDCELFVNEEFLLGPIEEKVFFAPRARGALPIAGKAYLIGPPDARGLNTGTDLSVDRALESIVFLEQDEAMAIIAFASLLAQMSGQGRSSEASGARPNLHLVQSPHGGMVH